MKRKIQYSTILANSDFSGKYFSKRRLLNFLLPVIFNSLEPMIYKLRSCTTFVVSASGALFFSMCDYEKCKHTMLL